MIEVIYYTDTNSTKCKLINDLVYKFIEDTKLSKSVKLCIRDLKNESMFKFVEEYILSVPTLVIKNNKVQYNLIGTDINVKTIQDTLQKVKNVK